MIKYNQLIDDLMLFYASDDFATEAVTAKNEFFDLAGMFDQQSVNFDLKIAQFTDWYIFFRKLSSLKQTPIEHFVDKRPKPISEEDEIYYRNLANNRFSLFEFLKLKGNDLYVRDLFSNYKLIIKDSFVTHGFDIDEYFQARLVPHEDSFLFTSAFCIHPPEATKFIRSEIKLVGKLSENEQKPARELLLLRLFRMRNKFDQYKHVGIKEIYSNQSRLRV
ncbi:MAG: hypothetical protein A2Z20_09900 [Bdellovibrionales bacterium RBG_16_40_8]|nr:MAG: hypothetical protein A2Z20_09900 [Bdellovibrionales bacterium RBG_16_40_8]